MFGQLPPQYSKAVHGPYDPAVFYGKKDMPLSQVPAPAPAPAPSDPDPGEGVPAARLDAPPPVLQPDRLRARHVQVRAGLDVH